VFETQQAQEWGKQELEDAGFPVKGIDHTTDKMVRAEQASLHYEMGRVTHAHGLKGGEGEGQLDAFPDGDHDDIVDTITTGIRHLEDAESGGGVAGKVRKVPTPAARRAARDAFRDPRGE
jgi:phage terminase large subunit-like protein